MNPKQQDNQRERTVAYPTAMYVLNLLASFVMTVDMTVNTALWLPPAMPVWLSVVVCVSTFLLTAILYASAGPVEIHLLYQLGLDVRAGFKGVTYQTLLSMVLAITSSVLAALFIGYDYGTGVLSTAQYPTWLLLLLACAYAYGVYSILRDSIESTLSWFSTTMRTWLRPKRGGKQHASSLLKRMRKIEVRDGLSALAVLGVMIGSTSSIEVWWGMASHFFTGCCHIPYGLTLVLSGASLSFIVLSEFAFGFWAALWLSHALCRLVRGWQEGGVRLKTLWGIAVSSLLIGIYALGCGFIAIQGSALLLVMPSAVLFFGNMGLAVMMMAREWAYFWSNPLDYAHHVLSPDLRQQATVIRCLSAITWIIAVAYFLPGLPCRLPWLASLTQNVELYQYMFLISASSLLLIALDQGIQWLWDIRARLLLQEKNTAQKPLLSAMIHLQKAHESLALPPASSSHGHQLMQAAQKMRAQVMVAC